MKFISYSQNLEDVMLKRALKEIPKGFYIDVGANDPIIDSVTKAFYDQGWNGINIEPVPQWYDLLKEQRPRDINLRVAAGDVCDNKILYEIENSGLSTLDKNIALDQSRMHGFKVIEHNIETLTLSKIIETYKIDEIHFLKIDVEGFEKNVLSGMNLDSFRPWIIIVESTRPSSQVDSYEDWEFMILNKNYILAYKDGLNRFYVSRDRPEILKNFAYPPNVFDCYIRNDHFLLKETNENLNTKNALLAQELHRLYKSKSWKLTKPLRLLNKFIKKN